jgi:acyl-coenzyme A synthetase/AMP-(fatty) acid ligase
MSHPTVLAALAADLRTAPGSPFLTTYDESLGERVELSRATFDNWVCKLANLFGSEWDLAAGDLVAVRLGKPWHLIAATIAAWTAGLTVTFDLTAPTGVPIGPWSDFARDVPGQPDALVLAGAVQPTDPAIQETSGTSTHAELVTRGRYAAASLGLTARGRLATDLDPSTMDGFTVGVLAPLVTGSSVVFVTGASAERRQRIAEQERATCLSWAPTAPSE